MRRVGWWAILGSALVVVVVVVVVVVAWAQQGGSTYQAVTHLTSWTTINPSAIACPASGSCVVVGTPNGQHVAEPEIVTLHGSTWSAAVAVGPRAAAASNVGVNVLNHVSCASADNCIAAGDFETDAGVSTPIVLMLHDGHWISDGGADYLRPDGPDVEASKGTGCSSSGQCWAAFEVLSSASGEFTYVVGESNGRWLPAHRLGATYQYDGTHRNVIVSSGPTCQASTCEFFGAVGWSSTSTFKTFIESTSGTSWDPSHIVPTLTGPFGLTSYDTIALFDCTGPETCMVGGGLLRAGTGGLTGVVEQEINGRWAPEVTGIGAAAPDDQSVVERVGCYSPALCVASGVTHRPGDEDLFVQVETDRHWSSPLLIPTGAPWAGAGIGSTPYSVSCPTATSCYVTGFFDASTKLESAFVARYLNGRWNDQIVNLAGTGESMELIDASCNTATCWAIASTQSSAYALPSARGYAFQIPRTAT